MAAEKTGRVKREEQNRGRRVEERRDKRRKEVKKYVLTVVATCIVCWGKVVLRELCPCVVSASIICVS